MIRKGKEVGWKMLVVCFQEVVDHLGKLRCGKNFAGGAGQRKGVSFTNAVKTGLSLVVSGHHALKVGDDVSDACGKMISHAKKMDMHALQAYSQRGPIK